MVCVPLWKEIAYVHMVAVMVCQIPAAGLHMDQELDVAVDFLSPELPGRYISYWRMASPSGPKFGQRVWVQIQVGWFCITFAAL